MTISSGKPLIRSLKIVALALAVTPRTHRGLRRAKLQGMQSLCVVTPRTHRGLRLLTLNIPLPDSLLHPAHIGD